MRYVCLACLLSSVGIADDWPRFRGVDGNAANPDASVPIEWDEERNLVWSSEIPGHGASSPVVFSDRVYVTSFTGYGLNAEDPGDRSDLLLHVICYDLTTGRQLWVSSLSASDDEQKATRRVADHGYASGTPACDESGVYAYFGVSGLVAIDHDGQQLWKATTGSQTAGFGSAASPILHQNLVIINASIESGTVYAFDRKSGDEVWRIEDVVRSWTTPLVATSSSGRDELIVSDKLRVRAFDPLTGLELWNATGIQDYVVPCVVANDGIAYVIGGRKNQSMAIRLGGTGDVTESHKLWETNVGANVTSPIYHDGYLYWSSDRGIANCLDAATGETVYRERMDTSERVYASSVLAGVHMYLTTRENGIFVIKVGTEYQQVAHNVIASDNSLINATPSVANDRLLVRTNERIYCIGAVE